MIVSFGRGTRVSPPGNWSRLVRQLGVQGVAQKLRWFAQISPLDYGKALIGVGVTIAVIGFSQNFLTIRMVYLVPLALVASRWGRGPAIVAVVLSFVVFDYFFIDPVGSFVATKPEEAVGLA